MDNTENNHPTLGRREFIAKSTLATGVATGLLSGLDQSTAALTVPKRSFWKSLKFGMIHGENLTIDERFAIAKNAGFQAVEPNSIGSDVQLLEFSKASEKHDIYIDALVCSTHWRHPLSDANPEVYNITMNDMRTCMKNIKELGGDMVLLVPAVVKPHTSYQDAWTRSVERVKILAEEAERLGITIGIENVWNKFLLSPIEAAAFIDEIDSKYVNFWFDVGNVVQFGYPEDWIRTLGHRIGRVDIKDFKRKGNSFCKLTEGDVDWPEVMRAFDEIGFGHSIHHPVVFAAEVGGGDEAYLREYVSKPMSSFLVNKGAIPLL